MDSNRLFVPIGCSDVDRDLAPASPFRQVDILDARPDHRSAFRAVVVIEAGRVGIT